MEDNGTNSTNGPNPKLLALIEKLVNPVDKCQINLELVGVFAFPEEWKEIDASNGFFTYQAKFMGVDINDGTFIAIKFLNFEFR